MPARRLTTAVLVAAATVVFGVRASAHVGSPDVYVDTSAGTYRLLVTVRPPRVIPGVAEVSIRIPDANVERVRITPLPLTGPGAQFAPTPDVASRASDDPHTFSGSLWMMSAGAWQVRIAVDGDRGAASASVPVPTLPQATMEMSGPLAIVLFALMLLLAGGLVGIVSALARDAPLAPGERPDLRAVRRGRIAGGVTAAAMIVVVLLGNRWWNAEASSYGRYVYKPLHAAAAVNAAGQLAITLTDPGWIPLRRVDDIVDDHGHPMHLFIVTASLDRFWHLHPVDEGSGRFVQALPPMPPGRYEFFADIVHATGISETATGTIDVPPISGTPLSGDDSAWSADDPASGIEWVGDRSPKRKALTMFTFDVKDEGGAPARDLELYMGMPGHAVFIRRDRQVFAHVHPSGSAPMAAMEIGQRSLESGSNATAAPMDHAAHMHANALPSTVTFPYGLPQPGDYRIFVQVKRAGHIETAAFDTHVD